MQASGLGATEYETAQFPRVAFLAIPGAPTDAFVTASMRSDAIDVEVLDRGSVQAQTVVQRPILLVWLPAGISSRVLETIVAWREQSPDVIGLIGCAPEGTTSDSERALAVGFDDFVSGRSSAREIAARVRALHRRVRRTSARNRDRMRWGRIVLDLARHELECGDRHVALTPLELSLIRALIDAAGGTLSREDLLNSVWGSDNVEIGVRAVDNLVWRLRQKIGDPALFVTVRGIGFRLDDRER